MTALVLLHGNAESPERWAAVTAELPPTVRALTPTLPFSGPAEAPCTLPRSATTVTAALDAAGLASASVCGIGLGALVALQLAADSPDRVDGLVLMTRQVRLYPMLMSVSAAVLRLLPATAAQRLGVDQAQLLALLDQVRPVDAAGLARRVRAPALVLVGALDPINRRASQSLATALPHGEFTLLPQAGPNWPTTDPTLLLPPLTTFLAQPR